ncbi:hypothetical protein [Hydrogenophaga sp. NFH-34]|uniref:hypothetical protein n=1 Tax=Hydrogenophaga sp. NFH-34 TaxID=2744446 RepID=UPI001F3BCFC7|nr:hypothetical protein [Hydrogenophaga sp. NFH-34]
MTAVLPKPSGRQKVLDVVHEQFRQGQQVSTRETVADITRLPLVTVDDTLKRLHNDGEIQRIARGRYAPAPPHQAVQGGALGLRW